MERTREKEVEKELATVSIYIMGRQYLVPASLTIMKAMEYAGYRYIRGCGCRAGFCGGCATLYRMEGEYKLHGALACQTTVQDGMYLAQIPFVPANKSVYTIEEIRSPPAILKYYPEVARCLSCNTCTKACPQEMEVMEYVQAALRGDAEKAAQLSFDCIQCGLCAVRCPAEIAHYHVAQLARRMYARYIAKPAAHLALRAREVDEGKFTQELDSLMKMDLKELRKLYTQREIEPE